MPELDKKINCTVCGKSTTWGEASSGFDIVVCPDCQSKLIMFLRDRVRRGR